MSPLQCGRAPCDPLQAQLGVVSLLHVFILCVPSCGGDMGKAHMGLLQAELQHPMTLSQTWGGKDTEPLPFRGAVLQRSRDAAVALWAQKCTSFPSSSPEHHPGDVWPCPHNVHISPGRATSAGARGECLAGGMAKCSHGAASEGRGRESFVHAVL